jgi:hypothetical protein
VGGASGTNDCFVIGAERNLEDAKNGAPTASGGKEGEIGGCNPARPELANRGGRFKRC